MSAALPDGINLHLAFRRTDDVNITCMFCQNPKCDYETRYFSRSHALMTAGAHLACLDAVRTDWAGRKKIAL